MRKKLLSILISSVLIASTSIGCGCSPSTLTVFSITEGDVYVMKAGTDSWIRAELGMLLEVGDIIKTGDNSSAEISFFDGSTVELEAGTEIGVASLDISAATGSVTIILEQTIGTIIFRVIKIFDPASRYEVGTPTGEVAVRGSAVEIHVAEDGTTRVASLEGEIWTAAQGVELQVPQGQQCIISPGQPPEISSFVQMTIVDVDSLDPAWLYDTSSGEQVQYIYETLLFYDGEEIDQFVPALATSWEFLADNATYRFEIREGVKFHEGGDLTAEDVEYSFERAMVQDRGGPVYMFFQSLLDVSSSDEVTFADIDGAVEAVGDRVEFHLSDPAWAIPFLQILCGPWASIVDKEWCIAQGDWDGTEATWLMYNHPQDRVDTVLFDKANGTGPWKLEEWDPGVQIKLARNDNYWRGPAAFDRIITRIIPEWAIRKAALLAGEADFVYVPAAYIDELEGIANLTIYKDLPETPLSIEAFFFNMAIAEDSTFIGSGALDGNGIPPDFFTDLDVRKGFNYAFDWETYINEAYVGEAEQRGSPIIEGLVFYNPDASMYNNNLTKAEEHLRLAWDGELWEKGFKLTLLYRSDIPQYGIACQILAENLVAINPKFEISIQSIARETYFDKIWARDMAMFQVGWVADYPHPNNFLYGFMVSYGPFAHLQGYGYPELDELIEEAFEELDPAVQEDLYYELQERYYEDAPSIMLVQPLARRYFTKYIEGFYFNPFIWGRAGPLYYMSKSES